jgi:hypothetical protein
VQYRLGQWLMVVTVRTNQEWVTYSVLEFVYLITSSLWSLAFIRFFWNQPAGAVAERWYGICRNLRDLHTDRADILLAHDLGWSGDCAAASAESVGRGLGFGRGDVAVARVAEAGPGGRCGGWDCAAGKTTGASRPARD